VSDAEFGTTAAERLVLTKRFLNRLSPRLRRQLTLCRTLDEFWDTWDWLCSLPEPPSAATADDYIRLIDPMYWSADELKGVR
jgi:hypothetical protein